MTGTLSTRDYRRLVGVHPHLVAVVKRAFDLVPFMVVEGLRTAARQRELVAEGKSQTMASRHLTGHAVDLVHWVDTDGDQVVDVGEIHWDHAKLVADAMKASAKALGYPIEWGGDWVSFRDGPHFQLPWKQYP